MNRELEQAAEQYAKKKAPFIWPKNGQGEEIEMRVGQKNPPGSKKAKELQRKLTEAFLAGHAHALAETPIDIKEWESQLTSDMNLRIGRLKVHCFDEDEQMHITVGAAHMQSLEPRQVEELAHFLISHIYHQTGKALLAPALAETKGLRWEELDEAARNIPSYYEVNHQKNCTHEWVEYKTCCYCGSYENHMAQIIPSRYRKPDFGGVANLKDDFSEWYFSVQDETGKPPLAMQIFYWFVKNATHEKPTDESATASNPNEITEGIACMMFNAGRDMMRNGDFIYDDFEDWKRRGGYKLPESKRVAGKEGELPIKDYEESFADHRRIVREIDVLINGGNAAKQASLCDIQAQLSKEWPKLRVQLAIAKKVLETVGNCRGICGDCQGDIAEALKQLNS